MKKVSIIIPAYNSEKYLSKTLVSVGKQTYGNIEIIIVDDGSKDNTLAIARDFQNNNSSVKVISSKNGGTACARNLGLTSAEGDYICFFDSDDIMLPNKIERQVAFLDVHPECELSYSDLYHFIDGTYELFHLAVPRPSGDMLLDVLSHGSFINPNSTMLRRSLFERVGGFDESLIRSEDLGYFLKLGYEKSVVLFQDEVLTLYRIRTNSVSADDILVYEHAVGLFKKYLLQIDINSSYRHLLEKQIYSYEKRLSFSFLKKGMKKEAWKSRPKSVMYSIFLLIGLIFPSILAFKLYSMIKQARFKKRFAHVYNEEVQGYLKEIECKKDF